VDRYRLEKGLKTHCGCRRQYKWRKDKEFPQEYLNKTKECTICREQIEYINFYFKEVVNINGEIEYIFNSRCVECDKKQAIIWANANIEKKRASCNKNSKKPNILRYHRELSQKQRDKGMARDWYNKDKERYKGYTIKYESHKHHTISEKDWIKCKEFFEYKCAYCNITEENHKVKYHQQLHKEHAYNEGDNGISNCVPACNSCNNTKKKQDWMDWYTSDNPRYTINRYNKIVEWLDSFNKNT